MRECVPGRVPASSGQQTPELVCYTSDVEHAPDHLVTALAALGLATHCNYEMYVSQFRSLADCKREYYAFIITFCRK